MALDKNKAEEIFNSAAKEARQPKTPERILKVVWESVVKKFRDDDSFLLSGRMSLEETELSVTCKNGGQYIQVAENKNGTFSVNANDQKLYLECSPEDAIAELGAFYGRHTRWALKQ
jgi:hypothetical protein